MAPSIAFSQSLSPQPYVCTRAGLRGDCRVSWLPWTAAPHWLQYRTFTGTGVPQEAHFAGLGPDCSSRPEVPVTSSVSNAHSLNSATSSQAALPMMPTMKSQS